MIYFTTEYNGNADQLILKPLHCEVHTQEVEILLLNIAQCLWKDVFSQRGICGKGPLQKTCSVGMWRKEKEKWKKSLTSENLQWRKVGVGTGLCQARHVSDGERRCWKYLSLRNCLNSFEIKTSIKLTNSKTKSPHLLQEEHTHAAVPREKTSRWPESSTFCSQFSPTHNCCYLLWGQHSGQGWREEADWGYLRLPLQHLQRHPPPCTGTSPSPSFHIRFDILL